MGRTNLHALMDVINYGYPSLSDGNCFKALKCTLDDSNKLNWTEGNVTIYKMFEPADKLPVPSFEGNIQTDGMELFINKIDEERTKHRVHFQTKDSKVDGGINIVYNMKDWVMSNIFNVLTLINTLIIFVRR